MGQKLKVIPKHMAWDCSFFAHRNYFLWLQPENSGQRTRKITFAAPDSRQIKRLSITFTLRMFWMPHMRWSPAFAREIVLSVDWDFYAISCCASLGSHWFGYYLSVAIVKLQSFGQFERNSHRSLNIIWKSSSENSWNYSRYVIKSIHFVLKKSQKWPVIFFELEKAGKIGVPDHGQKRNNWNSGKI